MNMDLDALRESITCSITGCIMHDPVQGNDGHTYEREAITKWLEQHKTSPQTRKEMTEQDLEVNASIRFLCDRYHAGAFGEIENTSREPPKISQDDIKINHTIKRLNENTSLLSFNVDENSFPKNLENGMSVQDIVNHAARTIITTLNSQSRIAVIGFDNEVIVIQDLTFMTEMNKSSLTAKVKEDRKSVV